jgi:DNA-binding LacI/PurR family transcriptional regulator
MQSLQEGIRTGLWRTHLPGERELCELLQVSRTTLRTALEELERKGVLEASARRRRRIKIEGPRAGGQKASKVIGVLMPSTFWALSPLASFVIDSVRETLARAGYVPELHVNQACFAARPAPALDKLARHHPAMAWLVFSSRDPMQHWFVRRRLPCLIMGSARPEMMLASIDADHRAACRHAGALLLRKGHRHLAMVLPQGAHGGDVDSEEGLREAVAGASHDAELRVLRHDGTTGHLSALLDDVFRAPHPPTAFVVARGAHVLTVMTWLLRRGKRIPEDVAVISRDNDPILHAVVPSIARYTINPSQFARRISMTMRQLVETGALEPKPIRLMPEFLPGETV